MTETKPLLIELGTEELPPKALRVLADAFAKGIMYGLAQRGIDFAPGGRFFCSPRRLAVHVPAVAVAQPDQAIERRGPALKVGHDVGGHATKALTGFAQSCGVAVDELQTLETDKGAWFVHRAVQAGQSTAALLPQIIAEALKNLPIPRPMRWGDHDYSFVRPAHWLVILLGTDVVEGELLGLTSDRQSHGHRFHHPQPVVVADADAVGWLDALRKAHVMADDQERADTIQARLREIALAAGLDLTPRYSPALLQELVNLTEWPVPILCRFDEEYLRLPKEVLRTTMEVNQRFISTVERGSDGVHRMSAWFFGIANIQSKDPDQIRKGYERVIRPRFADAKFFYDEDLKTPLADYQEQLKHVTYQQALGSLWDKTCRVAELARVIANRVGVDAGLATHAAALGKCDLMTRMVGEFPELQGVMGRYYAAAHGEPAEVAAALDEVYRPRHAGDAIAAGKLGQVLAVAERLDTLAGIFAVGMKPSGNKDPFALRRAALGLARTLVEGDLAIDLAAAFREALELLPDAALHPSPVGRGGSEGTAEAKRSHRSGPSPAPSGHPLPEGEGRSIGARRAALTAELHDFVLDRLRGYYVDQGFGVDQFEAVVAVAPASLPDFDRRLRAVAAFAQRPEAASLAAANKRVGNILRKQAETGSGTGVAVDPALFDHEAERALASALDAASHDSDRAVDAGDYAAALARLAELQAPVDHFFDHVLVMADDAAVRANRLALLGRLNTQFLAIADIGRLRAGG